MNNLSKNDVEALALGSTLLGYGGGGNPRYERLATKLRLEEEGGVELIQVEDLPDDALILPVAYMGAPLVTMEKIPSGREFEALLPLIEKFTGKKPYALLPAEIGGANALTPFAIAGKLGLPVVDGDLLGRAFPQLQMCSAALFGISPSPCFIGDSMGNSALLQAGSTDEVERLARQMTIAIGSTAAVALYLMSGEEAKCCVVLGSVSQACSLGEAILQGRLDVESVGGRVLVEGTIVDVDQKISDGFLCGTATMSDGRGEVVMDYQNENLRVRRGGDLLAVTPEIITPVDGETMRPITCDALQIGLRVALLALPAPEIWRSKEGEALVGAAAFGYEIEEVVG